MSLSKLPRGVCGSFIQTKILVTTLALLFVARIGNYGAHWSGDLIPFEILAHKLLFETMTSAIEMAFSLISRLSVALLALLHNIDLTIQTLVVNLNDMLLLRFLKDPSDIVHIPCLGLRLNLLKDSWVLWHDLLCQELLRERHGFNLCLSNVNIL